MSPSKQRNYLLAIPAVLTLLALTVPTERLQAAFGHAEASPKPLAVPCIPPGMGAAGPAVKRLSQG